MAHKVPNHDLFNNVDWQKVVHLAEEQGVLAIAFDSIEALQSDQCPDMDTLMDWWSKYLIWRLVMKSIGM